MKSACSEGTVFAICYLLRSIAMAEPFVDNYRLLARYNRRFNARLYDACEKLGDEERRRDRGAFFGSIHGTLNHLIWGDKLWLARFAAQQAQFQAVLTPELLALP